MAGAAADVALDIAVNSPRLPRRMLLGLMAGGAAWPAVAADASLARLMESGLLRAGIDFDETPMAFKNERGDADGLAPSIAQLLANGLGVTLDIVPVGKLDADVALLAGRIDLLVNGPPASIVLARSVMLADPFALFNHHLIARRSLAIDRIEDVAGFTVATLPEHWRAPLEPFAPRLRAQFLPAGSVVTAEQALITGAADAAILPDYMARPILERRSGLEVKIDLGPVWLSPALPYGQHTLLRALNSLLYLARQDGRLPTLHRGFLGRAFAAVPFF